MIDFVAAGLELSGMYTVGNKKRTGFLLHIAGDIVWIYIGITAGLYGLISIAGLALVLNVRNFVKWRRDAENQADIAAIRHGMNEPSEPWEKVKADLNLE